MATAKKLPSGSWRIKAYLGIDENGKKIYKSFTCDDPSLNGKKKCELMAIEYAMRSDSTHLKAISFEDAMDSYLLIKKSVLSPSTMRGYNNIKNSLLREHKKFCEKDVMDITQDDIQILVSTDAKTLSPKSVRNRHGFISAVIQRVRPEFQFNTTLPQKDASCLYIPTDEEIKKLIKSAEGTELYIPILLAAFCTMRRGEICALSMDDIEGTTIHVRHSLVQGSDKEYHMKNPKTVSSDRYIDAPAFVTEAIYKKGYITKLNPHSITIMFGRLLEKNNIPHFRFHDLRHYSISVQHALGIPDQYIMLKSGHATTHTLQAVYRHAMSDRQKEMSDIANNHFANLM